MKKQTIKAIKLWELVILVANDTPPARVIYGSRVFSYNEDYKNYSTVYNSIWLFTVIGNVNNNPLDIELEIIE